MGGLDWAKMVHEHQWWRLISCMWLHGGLVHLISNMTSLVIIAIRLEQQFGFVRVGVIYLVSGIGGGVLSALFLQRSVSVGASGALFGLLGAIISELFTNWTIYTNKAAGFSINLLFIVSNLALGFLPLFDNFAHVGGLLTGFLLGFVLLLRPRFGWLERHQFPEHRRLKSKYLAYQLVLLVISLATLLTGFIVLLTLLLQGTNGHDHCKWCRYLNCVPSSKWRCET